ncbi:MAG: T9SS type A sorting domain-containing protein [Aureispira sp.]|nr:T9SS type A sorting domain-containing protein [Aureispira sp.]
MNLIRGMILTLLILCVSASIVHATHAAGSDLSYEQIGPNQYQVTLKLYRDCSGINLSGTQPLYITDTCGMTMSIQLQQISQRDISTACPSAGPNSCNGGTVFGYEERIYQGVFGVAPVSSCTEVKIEHRLCCRNGAITNIAGAPNNEQLVTKAIIYRNVLSNSSPVFISPPIGYFKAHVPINISFAVVDLEGDSLAYFIDNPIGYSSNMTTSIPWLYNDVFDSLTTYTFDSTTGQMDVTFSSDQVPVFDVVVEEYRNGFKIGETRRSMQYYVVTSPNSGPVLDSVLVYDNNGALQNQGLNTIFESCPGRSLHFQTHFSDSNTLDTVLIYQQVSTLYSLFPDAVVSLNYTGLAKNIGYLDVFIPSVKTAVFSIGLTDGACPYQNIQSYSFNIIPEPSCNSVIRGNIAHDNSGFMPNCLIDPNEPKLAGFIVLAQKGGFTSYTVTDTLGNYSMTLDTGTYQVQVIPSTAIWTSCQGIQTVNLLANNTAIVDFPMQTTTYCPWMQVDISTGVLTRCFPAVYNVQYCNLGTSAAVGSYVEVTIDSGLIVDSTSIPIASQTGNTYTFNLGTVNYNDCGSFYIYTRVGCDSTVSLGQTHCVEAHIYPDVACTSNPLYSGTDINLSASCDGDSVSFEIENTGTAMSNPLSYRLIANDILASVGSFQLGMGASQELQYPTTGATYRLEADQAPYHPWSTIASATVEGCFSGPFQTGLVNIFSLNDAAPYVSIDCQENVGAYDPNDKQAYPEGYGNLYYIKQNEDLEYKIRFQNTGTAPAQNVVIRDTLSSYLDITTVQPGASSHPYTWQLLGEDVIEYRFTNIMLPDSNSNEPASHGFIKFKLKQQVDNPLGMVIYNDAAIYFDYNAPIITNETFHTIGDNFVAMVITGTEEVLIEDVEVKVYPNPFTAQATLEVEGGDYQSLELTIYDITGREVAQYQTGIGKDAMHSVSTIQIQRNNLPQGVYIYRLQGDDILINTGKIIIK